MKILFTRPGDIFSTPALERALFATERIRTSTILVDWNEKKDEIKENKSEYHYKKDKNKLTLIKWQFYLFHKLFKNKPDITFNMSVLSAFPILIYSLFSRKKSVYDCRDYFAYSYKFNLFIRGIIRFFDNIYGIFSLRIIVPDEYGLEYFSMVNKDKIILVPNTVIDHGYRKMFNNGPIRIAYLGYLSYDRNINAIFRFVKNNKDIELHIAISYLSSKLKNIIPNYDNIIIHEKLPHEKAQELLSKMDYCLLTYNPQLGNYKYIQPTKFYDCLAIGLPYICSKGNINLEKHQIGTSNISVEYDSIKFPILNKTEFSDYNRNLYNTKYSYNKVLNKYREDIELLLKLNRGKNV